MPFLDLHEAPEVLEELSSGELCRSLEWDHVLRRLVAHGDDALEAWGGDVYLP